MSIKDDFLRQKYFLFIQKNKINIVSDIFERMEMDRKHADEKRKMMTEGNLTHTTLK